MCFWQGKTSLLNFTIQKLFIWKSTTKYSDCTAPPYDNVLHINIMPTLLIQKRNQVGCFKYFNLWLNQCIHVRKITHHIIYGIMLHSIHRWIQMQCKFRPSRGFRLFYVNTKSYTFSRIPRNYECHCQYWLTKQLIRLIQSRRTSTNKNALVPTRKNLHLWRTMCTWW